MFFFFFFFDDYKDQKPTFKANKGEWSELYTMFKLLGDGILYAGDEKYNKRENFFYPILSILREEVVKKNKLKYKYNVSHVDNDITKPSEHVQIYQGEELILDMDSRCFVEAAERLLKNIQDGSGLSFYSSAGNEAFIKKIHCRNIKRDSDHKADITLKVYDSKVRITRVAGFSIKSLIGSNPTLLNASDATLITYKIVGGSFIQEDIDYINAITGNNKLKKRIAAIKNKGGNIVFKEYNNPTFRNNLESIDYGLPKVLAEAVLQYFSNNRISMIDDIAEKIAITNPLQLERSDKQKFYSDILVKLLNASAAGMFPSKPYIKSDDVKGYIIVRNDGEVVCYDFYEQNVVDKHLHDNTKFDTPSSEKKNKNGEYQRTPYCRLYRNDKGELEIQLNFQIRWT
jgi:hypothetical protein